ncbi:MAG: CHAD domain-containing protein [Methylacidiphilales bacterium]|nr:CHAD domain-containing protein [Candidatus Methylacidiphilales bacterium]
MKRPALTYAFLPHEEIRRGFVRILGEIPACGRDLARRSRKPAGELIHEGRLLIKRMRALLWFARDAVGFAAYAHARAQLRSAAALLSDQRDLGVTRATLEQLARKVLNPRDRTAVRQVARRLVGKATAGGVSAKALREELHKAMTILDRSADEIQRSATDRAAWPSPSERLAKAFRATRQAGKRARRTGKDTDFHEWRKKAKRLLYQLELTQPEPGRQMARVKKRVEKLQSILGDYHDGVVAGSRLRQMIPVPASARRVVLLLEKRKARLRKKACKLAVKALSRFGPG